MISEREILGLTNEYCYAIDTGDLEALGRLLEHAEWIAEGKKATPETSANIILYSNGTPRTRPTTSAVALEVDEANRTAQGRC